MDAIQQAHVLRTAAEQALAGSRAAREYYVQGMRETVSEDELRHRHYDALDAATRAANAQHALLGERKVTFYVD